MASSQLPPEQGVSQPQAPAPAFLPAPGGSATFFFHHLDVHVYQLTDSQLDQLIAATGGVNLAFAAALFGAMVTLVVTLITANFTDITLFGAIAALVAIGVMLAYFSILAKRDYSRTQNLVKRLKNQP